MIDHNYVNLAMEMYPGLLETSKGEIYFSGIFKEIFIGKLEYFTSINTLVANSDTYFDMEREYVDIRLDVLNQKGKLILRLKRRLSEQVCIALYEMNIRVENRPNVPYITVEIFDDSHYDLLGIARKHYINNIINDQGTF